MKDAPRLIWAAFATVAILFAVLGAVASHEAKAKAPKCKANPYGAEALPWCGPTPHKPFNPRHVAIRNPFAPDKAGKTKAP